MRPCFNYCPACGLQSIQWVADRFWHCPACDFDYFHNVATAAGLILTKDTSVLTVIRAKDPALGKLGLPGGFVDPGERAEEAVLRECLEEIGWRPQTLHFLASFPNTYTYRTVVYNTCDLFFTADATCLGDNEISCDPEEVSGIQWIHPATVDPARIAFDSTRKALQHYISTLTNQTSRPSPQ